MKVLFVCLGNICRSPLGEGILRRQAADAGVDIEIDSAGTGDYHIGQLPDDRAIRVGIERGCEMTMRARQFRTRDFSDFDLIVAMDEANLRALRRWPGSVPSKIRLARSFDPAAITPEVPDPYYGNHQDFEEVADMLESACQGILQELLSRTLPQEF
jgi:protein-tyrosine phosphatase